MSAEFSKQRKAKDQVEPEDAKAEDDTESVEGGASLQGATSAAEIQASREREGQMNTDYSGDKKDYDLTLILDK